VPALPDHPRITILKIPEEALTGCTAEHLNTKIEGAQGHWGHEKAQQ